MFKEFQTPLSVMEFLLSIWLYRKKPGVSRSGSAPEYIQDKGPER